MSTKDTIQILNQRLQKALNGDDDQNSDDEVLRDCLQQLKDLPMTLPLLTETLIGATVAKFKSHDQVGTLAKDLVKQWKQIAKQQEKGNGSSSKKSSKSKEAATRRPSLKETDVASHWADLQPHRQSICQKLFEVLQLSPAFSKKLNQEGDGWSEEARQSTVAHTAVDTEEALSEHFAQNNKGYSDKARSLAFNLKKNPELSTQLIFGVLTPTEFIQLPPERLAPPQQQKERQDQAKKMVDSRRLDWEQANEDKINQMCGIEGELLKASLFTCGRCKSVKTTSTQKQTRSADEPMTVFVLCMSCGNRWKC